MLTSQDLSQIEKLFIKFGEKFEHKLDQLNNKIDSLETRLSKKIDERADQIIEYVNINTEAHEKWLQDHEVRIHDLEDNGYQFNDQNKE